jgi:hypothetical protein
METQPRPEAPLGRCPYCEAELVSVLQYVTPRGYLLTLTCPNALLDEPTCSYRHVLLA